MVMRYTLCVGDSPVTGGAVLPYDVSSNTISGHQAAPIGGKVRCEKCDSVGIIIKAGGPRRQKMGVNGIQALDGDLCLCKCSPPPPIKATMQSTMRYCDDAYGLPEYTPNKSYDEQLRLQNEEGKLFANFSYVLTLANGEKISGVTDEHGRTDRIETDEPTQITHVEIRSQADICCSIFAAKGKESSTSATAGYNYYIGEKMVLTNSPGLTTSLKSLTLEGQTRSLTAGEIAISKKIFKDSINYSKVKVHRGSFIIYQPDSTAMTPFGDMYFPFVDDPRSHNNVYRDDFSIQKAGQENLGYLFIHEMTHVWQHQMGYNVFGNGILIGSKGGYRGGSPPPAYRYKDFVTTRHDFSEFNMEQQGDIIKDYFLGKLQMTNGQIMKILGRFIKNPKNASLLPKTTNF